VSTGLSKAAAELLTSRAPDASRAQRRS
jgi:hypothetical protein